MPFASLVTLQTCPKHTYSKRFLGLFAVIAVVLISNTAVAQNPPEVIYTISAEEALAGPKPADQNILLDKRPKEGQLGEASISVNAKAVLGKVNPMVFGACFEDLNHEIYGGLHAQMLYGKGCGGPKTMPLG